MQEAGAGGVVMRRRTFIAMAAGAAAAIAAAGWGALRKASPRAWVRAIRAGRYPGRVVRLDERSMKERGKWMG